MKNAEAKWGGSLVRWFRESPHRRPFKFISSRTFQHPRKNFGRNDFDDVEDQKLLGFDSCGYFFEQRRRSPGRSKVGSKGFRPVSYNPVVAVLIFTVAWIYLYMESLIGGDLQAVIHNLGWMAVTFFSAATGALRDGIEVWDKGFRGERMLSFQNHNVCTPVDRGLPWVDMFPEGYQNFGASTFTCGDLEMDAKAVGFSVNFSMDGALTASCNTGNRMTYTPLPSTVDWPKGDKLVEETYEGLLARPFNKNVMDKVREAGEIPYEAQSSIYLPEEIEAVIVRCGGVEKLVTRVRPSSEILKRTASQADQFSPSKNEKKLNVVFLFLDATSRRGFHRRLRRTVAALEEADARGDTRLYQFFRYSVVEFCTEPNSRAMFQNAIKPHKEIVPPVWDDYRNSGYVTLFTADTCQDLAAAYMNRQSPRNTSSFDHELISPFCHSDYFAEDANPFGNFKGPYSICARCLKGEQVHEHELRYLQSFRTAYPDTPKFSLAWFLEGHEGTTEVLRNLDDGLAAYVGNFTAQDWNSTAVIIAADHGLHMGLNFAMSQNGAVEHKNPFMAMMLPPWFTDRHNRNEILSANQQKMVTALDIYKTLQALRMAGLSEEQRRQWVDPASEYRLHNVSIDLLHHEVPESRSCEDAGISSDWCQCL
ncbi:uncharacterized protein [Physcomitrium patens]|uniref:uncharacterized protein isoform X2 n=1 Tax=Physcomitrium patens TaxID=3218 RepID=UPI000D1532ED|nr:uncharacterized protein LOC112282953 isoform X2 [Physcomitrium patens]|eukprot:XP_024376955.1 uncharacterized protein LOC112282953 isoform X2 [Physcomitrella patens]